MEKLVEGRKKIAVKAAKAAGKILVDNFRKPLKVKFKKDKSLVTEIDLAAERKIVGLIKEKYPQDNILSEENKFQTFKSNFRWIIDPLDGTHNYIHKIEIFGTSIALEFKKEVILGVIYLPLTDKLYLAEKGKGAYLYGGGSYPVDRILSSGRDGKRMKVSQKKLENSTMVYDSSIRYHKKSALNTLEKIVDRVFNIRMFGSSVYHLSYIAEGKIDLDIEFNDKLWDFAAGLLLIEEAGGKATDFQGKKWNSKTKGYIASNGIVHEDVLKIMGRKLKGGICQNVR